MKPSPLQLKNSLSQFIPPERILIRDIERIAFASDASFYRLIPTAIVFANGFEEIRNLFRFSRRSGVPVTFRGAGTSLSGQAITDGILVEVARFWRNCTILDNGTRVRVQPGIIGARVNQALTRFQRKLGPDPASISTCTVGGILANNSSGMCCGVEHNSYQTLESMKFVLPSGTVIDTASVGADEEFRSAEPALAAGIAELRRTILGDTALCNRIRFKYRRKNTTGYSLNAFLDFERPVEIFEHLLIGSEGTLGFIGEAVLRTVRRLPLNYTGLLSFPNVYAASEAVPTFSRIGAKAIEIMDRSALRSIERQPTSPSVIRDLPEQACALLVEFQATTQAEFATLQQAVYGVSSRLELPWPAVFTSTAEERAAIWKLRSGMFPSVGAARKSGTTVIIEDVGFPVEQLAGAILELRKLFVKHRYRDAIIFGHAKEGNLHFVISQSFNDQKSIDQYARFIEDVVRLVVDRYDGSLKAEHGTGRNMAPFVESEWGTKAYQIMKKLKSLVDPENLLNPGVIITDDRAAHLRHLKSLPSVEPEVDKCIECGYCEPRCPSRELTLTPRQRIAVRREIYRLKAGNRRAAAELEREFAYPGLDTCAADGMCATSCPVQIDTGQLVKLLRKQAHSKFGHWVAVLIAEHFRFAAALVRQMLALGHFGESVAGYSIVAKLSAGLRLLLGKSIPAWQRDMPYPALRPIQHGTRSRADAVYLPSCISRVMGEAEDPHLPTTQDVFLELADRAGISMFVPDDAAGTCCGTPFGSKGFERAQETALNRAIEKLWLWSDSGRLPIVMDTTPCSYAFRTCRSHLSIANRPKLDKMQIVDGVEYVHDTLLKRLNITNRLRTVALHPVCSLVKLGLLPRFEQIARACSQRVLLPQASECCGFAGDRGFLFPELTASATRAEVAELKGVPCEGFYSSSRTCEIAMTRATGEVYRSYLHMVHRATDPE